ncbi:hypothetical protein Q7P37_008575 [Cladosporium fusiforme]
MPFTCQLIAEAATSRQRRAQREEAGSSSTSTAFNIGRPDTLEKASPAYHGKLESLSAPTSTHCIVPFSTLPLFHHHKHHFATCQRRHHVIFTYSHCRHSLTSRYSRGGAIRVVFGITYHVQTNPFARRRDIASLLLALLQIRTGPLHFLTSSSNWSTAPRPSHLCYLDRYLFAARTYIQTTTSSIMAAAARPPPEIIDLVSDSDDELPSTPTPAARRVARRSVTPEEIPSRPPSEPDPDDIERIDDAFFDDVFYERRVPGQFDDQEVFADGDLPHVPLVIDDFGYLNEDPQEQFDGGADQGDDNLGFAQALGAEQTLPDSEEVLTEDHCLARVYEMFPDVCPDHVSTLYTEVAREDAGLPIAVYLDRIIEKMLSTESYPKRRKESQQLKRKREESVDEDRMRWEGEGRDVAPWTLVRPIRAILKAEFPTFTHAFINQTLGDEKYLYQTYVRLAEIRDTDGPFRQRGRASMQHTDADLIATNTGFPELGEELAAARRRVHSNQEQRASDAKKKQSEDENLRRAIAAGNTAECQACFDDLPMNRQIHCQGETAHFTCYSCMEAYIKSEIGESRCRVLCTAGCGSAFEPAQLNLLSDKKLLAKLADLQQEKDIRDAALENLEECPFCDYKAILPPIEEDFEFRCANPECEKVSCRRCKASSHIPISCEQFAKDNKVNSRHKIEEAMTAALIRSCNRCKKQFIKEYGCNKMTCPSCQNLQCYVCSETLKGYEHFDQHPGGRGGNKCPLYDNLEQRHEREVKAAEDATRAEIMANNPDVVAEDLEIKMSDVVNKATEQKIRQAGPEGLGGGPMGFGGAHFLFDGEDGVPAAIRGLAANRRMRNPNAAVRHRMQQRNREINHRLEGRLQELYGAQPAQPGLGVDPDDQEGDLAAARNPFARRMDRHIFLQGFPPPAANNLADEFAPGAIRPGREAAAPNPQFNRPPEEYFQMPVAGQQRLPFQPAVARNAYPAVPMAMGVGPPMQMHGYFPMGVNVQPPALPPAPNNNQLILAGVQANLRQLEIMRRQHDVRQAVADEQQQQLEDLVFEGFDLDEDRPLPPGAALRRRR